MVTRQTVRCSRQISVEEQKLYDHLLYWVELESPNDLVERFHSLFIDGTRYPDAEIAQALDKVIASATAPEEFRYVLNRCCHILINRWQSRSQFQAAIPQLIALFDTVPTTASPGVYRSRSVRRLRELIKLFRDTEQYVTLHRLAQVLSQSADAAEENRPLGSLIRRYPYLYEHCLLSEDSTQEQQHTVRQIQTDMQRQFEINLSQYVTYQIRRSRQASMPVESNSQRLILRPVSNPTLLMDQDVGRAIKHYVGKVDGMHTHKELAQRFLLNHAQSQSFGAFKDDLYQYIMAAVEPEYGRRQFSNQFYKQLQNTYPDSNNQQLNDFLMVRTCSQLLNFLVVDSPQHPNHFVFIDLITNVGPILTTGILLKIVLLCRKVKPYLERRLAILFNHYESSNRAAVEWLIYALENLNIALSTNFGAVDLALIR